MTLNWLEIIGYCGTLATFISYAMRTIVPLRVASIMSSVFFITYASVSGVWPMLATELVLLPLNLVRLSQDMKRPALNVSTATNLACRVSAQSGAACDPWLVSIDGQVTYSLGDAQPSTLIRNPHYRQDGSISLRPAAAI